MKDKASDKIWNNLKKEYLTIEQKKAIIQEHYMHIANDSIAAVRIFLKTQK